MYNIIHLISALIRQFVLPNPYINIIGNETYADLFNIFIGGTILHFLVFFLTGCGYTRGVNDPASGSAGYLISYCYLTGLITLLGYLISNVTFFIIIFIVLYVISCIVVNKVFDKSIF